MLTLTFLGTGTSNGIPIIGCACAVCTSTDPRDRRTRTSAVLHDHDADRIYLIDAATELRFQAIAAGMDRVDAVLMTHAHADHTSGLDDLRRFNELQKARIPIYAGPDTAAMLRDRYAYAFDDTFPFFGGKPDLDLHTVDGAFRPFDREFVPVPVGHGRTQVLGFRVGNLAYVTDAKIIPDASLDLLRGLDVLVLNTLRERPHPTHLNVAEALAVIADVQPRRAYLVHLSHDLGHQHATDLLPPGVEVAYDGLEISIGRIDR